LLGRTPPLESASPSFRASTQPQSAWVEAADRLARQLGKSRSQLYAEAVREYLERHRDEDITRRLNEIYDAEPELAELDPVLDALQVELLRREEMVGEQG